MARKVNTAPTRQRARNLSANRSVNLPSQAILLLTSNTGTVNVPVPPAEPWANRGVSVVVCGGSGDGMVVGDEEVEGG